jgi:esterase/lipase superfamily enzyme
MMRMEKKPMRTGRFALTVAAVLLGGGLLVWAGCGGGGGANVDAPPTDSETSADPGRASPGEDDLAASEEKIPEEPSGEIWIQPDPSTSSAENPFPGDVPVDPIGPVAPMPSHLEQPNPTPEPAKTAEINPIRLPDAGSKTILPEVTPMRTPLRSMLRAPDALIVPKTADESPAELSAPAYRMMAPAPDASTSMEHSIAESRGEMFPSGIPEPPVGEMLPMMAPMPDMAEPSALRASEPAAIDSEPARPAPAESLAASDSPDAGEAVPEEDPDYKMVTVFYGTDRNALSGDAALKPFYSSNWFMLAAAAGGVTLLLLIVSLWISRSRTAMVLAGLGMLATFALTAVTGLDYVQARASTGRLARTYGNERGQLEMGTCQVSIPKRHEIGQVERPSLLKGEVFEDPRRHVVMLTINLENEDQFYSGLEARVNRSQRKEAFVFVHGFNVTFDEAARRTAQLAFDLDFDGPPIFFSWPSQGGLLKYAVDETNVVWTVPHLKQFLLGVARRSGADSVHLIAHSMGNRALTSALQAIAYEMRDEPPIFREVLLTAPDIDADVFKRDIAPAIVQTAERVTLYASSNDEALTLSKQVHGYPRAGDSGPGLVVVPGIDTIDVSTIDTSLLGHSYYGSNHTVIADMLDLLHEAKPPDQRPFLRPRQLGQMFYWIFNPERLSGLAPGPEPAVR